MKSSKEKNQHIKPYVESDFDSDSVHLEIPNALNEKILSSMKSYVKPDLKFVGLKYSIIFIFSGLVSLLLCPQKGVGFLEEYPLFFHSLHSNVLLCGLYCGVFFAGLTHVSAMIFLNYFERLTIYSSLKFLPHAWSAVFFGGFMFLGEDFYRLDLYYNLAWVLAVVFVVWISSKIKIPNLSFN